MDLHVFPILIPPPTSLSTQSVCIFNCEYALDMKGNIDEFAWNIFDATHLKNDYNFKILKIYAIQHNKGHLWQTHS